ncbi:translation initiation factor IF-2-like [Lutra lutra]|uniref:translation initiation factor IF-2-like n=1 Tax=Lutra lutra TaxID=9657 RepID=UPI001FD28F8E|nr:translation initiation factor IF-2-like [Lutra lutra]
MVGAGQWARVTPSSGQGARRPPSTPGRGAARRRARGPRAEPQPAARGPAAWPDRTAAPARTPPRTYSRRPLPARQPATPSLAGHLPLAAQSPSSSHPQPLKPLRPPARPGSARKDWAEAARNRACLAHLGDERSTFPRRHEEARPARLWQDTKPRGHSGRKEKETGCGWGAAAQVAQVLGKWLQTKVWGLGGTHPPWPAWGPMTPNSSWLGLLLKSVSGKDRLQAWRPDAVARTRPPARVAWLPGAPSPVTAESAGRAGREPQRRAPHRRLPGTAGRDAQPTRGVPRQAVPPGLRLRRLAALALAVRPSSGSAESGRARRKTRELL